MSDRVEIERPAGWVPPVGDGYRTGTDGIPSWSATGGGSCGYGGGAMTVPRCGISVIKILTYHRASLQNGLSHDVMCIPQQSIRASLRRALKLPSNLGKKFRPDWFRKFISMKFRSSSKFRSWFKILASFGAKMFSLKMFEELIYLPKLDFEPEREWIVVHYPRVGCFF